MGKRKDRGREMFNEQVITELEYDDYRHAMFKLDHSQFKEGETNWRVLVGAYDGHSLAVVATNQDNERDFKIIAMLDIAILQGIGRRELRFGVNQDNSEYLNKLLIRNLKRQVSTVPLKYAAEETLDRLIELKSRVTPLHAREVQAELQEIETILEDCQEKIVDIYNIVDDWANNV